MPKLLQRLFISQQGTNFGYLINKDFTYKFMTIDEFQANHLEDDLYLNINATVDPALQPPAQLQPAMPQIEQPQQPSIQISLDRSRPKKNIMKVTRDKRTGMITGATYTFVYEDAPEDVVNVQTEP